MKKYIIIMLLISTTAFSAVYDPHEVSIGVVSIYEQLDNDEKFSAGIYLNTLTEIGEDVGFQFGGVGEVQENDEEAGYLTLGVMFTQIDVSPNNKGLIGFNIDYTHTAENVNLVAVRPTAAVPLGDTDALGIWGQFGVYRDDDQEALDQAAVFWNHLWGYRLLSEVSLGYRFGNEDELRPGLLIAYQYSPSVELQVFGETSLDTDDYLVGVGISVDIDAPEVLAMSGKPSIMNSKSTSIHNTHNSSVPLPMQRIVPVMRTAGDVLPDESPARRRSSQTVDVSDSDDDSVFVCEDNKRGRGHTLSRGGGHERNHCEVSSDNIEINTRGNSNVTIVSRGRP